MPPDVTFHDLLKQLESARRRESDQLRKHLEKIDDKCADIQKELSDQKAKNAANSARIAGIVTIALMALQYGLKLIGGK